MGLCFYPLFPGLQNRHYDESHNPCYGHEQKKAYDPQGNSDQPPLSGPGGMLV
jgi:hypothetical protein